MQRITLLIRRIIDRRATCWAAGVKPDQAACDIESRVHLARSSTRISPSATPAGTDSGMASHERPLRAEPCRPCRHLRLPPHPAARHGGGRQGRPGFLRVAWFSRLPGVRSPHIRNLGVHACSMKRQQRPQNHGPRSQRKRAEMGRVRFAHRAFGLLEVKLRALEGPNLADRSTPWHPHAGA